MKTLSDETLNDMAVDWYFLDLQSGNQEVMVDDEVFNELIEIGLKLKEILKYGKFTETEPMNVFVEGDTYFDIWLDSDHQIRVSGLYHEEYDHPYPEPE